MTTMEKTAYDVLADTRTNVEEILAKMLFIKKEGRNRAELRELFTQASVAFLNLRQINRIILQDEDRIKQETEAAKLPVDYTTLQLNNLLYEKNHYVKAINACKDFKSKYPDIELVPEEEFFRDAPPEFKKDPAIKDDPHKKMLERLNFELYQRKELCKQRELLEARKKMLQESIANKKKFLSSLPSHLKALKKASLPVQQQLGILHTKRMKQHHLAELLPAPLYILYTQIMAYKEAFDESIELEIIGSAKDAQALARQQAIKDSGVSGATNDDSKAEEDLQEDDDDSQRRRKRTKKSHSKEPLDEGIYHAHPLSILWHIYDDDLDENGKLIKLLSLKFEYLVKINVVCVGIDGIPDGPLNLLTNLFPDDTGLELPTEVAKLSAGADFQYDPTRRLHPYKWAQHLAGVDFLTEGPPVLDATAAVENPKGIVVKNGLAAYRRQHRVQTVLEKLRSRRKGHIALKEQLDTLSSVKLPECMYREVPWNSSKAKCYLQSWSEITPCELQKLPMTTDVTSALIPLSSPLDEVDVSPRSGLESMREDGELPAAGLSAYSSKGSKYADFVERKALYSKDKTRTKGLSVPRAKSSFGMLGTIGFEGLEAGISDDGNGLSESSILAEVGMEDVGITETVNSFVWKKIVPPWEDCGCRVFTAIFRRDAAAQGKSIDLEAQVKISCEYPVRPPHFTLRSVSEGLLSTLPAPPAGVLDVVEKPRVPSANIFSFNELRSMEIEVNMRALEYVPENWENEILVQQLSLLAMVFDVYVDHLLSVNDKSTSTHIDSWASKLAHRPIRGRDRLMQVL